MEEIDTIEAILNLLSTKEPKELVPESGLMFRIFDTLKLQFDLVADNTKSEEDLKQLDRLTNLAKKNNELIRILRDHLAEEASKLVIQDVTYVLRKAASSSTKFPTIPPLVPMMGWKDSYDRNLVLPEGMSLEKAFAFSVRCIQD